MTILGASEILFLRHIYKEMFQNLEERFQYTIIVIEIGNNLMVWQEENGK